MNDFKFLNLLVGKYYLGDDQIRDEEMGRACGTYEEERNTFRVLVGKAKGNRQLVKLRHIWEETVKIDLKKKKSNSVVWYCMDWIHLA